MQDDSQPRPRRADADGPRRDEGDGEPRLAVRSLTKTYPSGVTAVDDVTLELAAGELLVLVGPSGCGKSTTLRCIAGLEEPTAGDVRIDGTSVLGVKPEARDIAMVFQNYALYPHKTARENIGFGLRMTTDLSADEVAARVERVAETLGIVSLLDQLPASLSGGQQQRVALGRAIVRDPAVFLLDEPLSNLDATLRARMRTEIQRLQQELDVTTVHVTHDQTEAMTMGDRIAVLDDGRLQQVGTPLECYHEPANLFVAGFLGEPSMNLLEVRPAGNDGFDGAIAYPAVEPLTTVAERGPSELVLGARPEAVELRPATAGADDGTGAAGRARNPRGTTARGTVTVVEPVGERTIVHVDLDAGRQVVASVGSTRAVRRGLSVEVRLPPERLHVFDGASGEALHHPDPAALDVDPFDAASPAGRD